MLLLSLLGLYFMIYTVLFSIDLASCCRLSSTEEGCSALFAHCDWSLFVGHLIASLGGESLGLFLSIVT